MTLLPAATATIRMEDFYTEGGDSLIPHRPGLYVWTIDVGMWLGADKPTVQTLVQTALSAVGFEYEATVGPYTTLKLQDFRKPVRPQRQVVLHDRINAKDPFGEWIAGIATSVQRPLYLGMANDLYKRIKKGHLANKTPLLRNVRERGLNVTDLAVTWWAAPVEASAVHQDGEDEQDDELVGPIDDLEPADDDGGVDPVMDARLKAVESLLIRMAMPMLNGKQD
jgi:hypothetical protein